MTDVVDIDQMEATPLPVPSTSRAPAPRPASTASARNSATPGPQTPKPPQRMTRARAAATASASGSHKRPEVPTARHPLHHATNTAAKREPSSSLTPPPDITAHDKNSSLGAQGGTGNSRDSSESGQGSGHDVGDRRSPPLVTRLSPHADPAGSVMRSTAQNYSSAVDDPSPAPAASVSLPAQASHATTQTTDDHPPVTLSSHRAPSLPSNLPQKRKSRASDSESDDDRPLLSEYMCPICFSPPKSAVITPETNRPHFDDIILVAPCSTDAFYKLMWTDPFSLPFALDMTSI
ncbi:hypothetical protein FRC10_003497 [Ceratobasidium sp. 414]|nr:hypothetical protein FRC10_003497 [Ceratobasidium sp. 414]